MTRRTAPVIVLLLALVACASHRERALRTMYAGATTAQAGFVAWDRETQLELARSAPSLKDGQAALAEHAKKREPVAKAFEGVYRAIAAAALLDEDHASLASTVAAFEQLRTALRQLTGGKLP